ncbi:hypothetical protein LOK49_LG01G02614 [Camellia lanceoleosa]|uniref:Uncharacterized protein n=1 Tax=Camellia lanceoleosa TaxID=1840588 RepID=A0ACC0J024_9ERIC|nr:hypothetical protein LOK49_LG01G02614 [Camellia lanceoleosa]
MAAMMNSAHINATGSGSKQKHSSGKTLQNKRVIGAAALANNMDNLLNSMKTQSKELTVNHVVEGHNITMGQAVGRLYEIQGLDPEDELLHFGVMLMEVPNNREMVMSIPTDRGIIGWLQAKKQDKDRNGGVTLVVLYSMHGMNNDDDDPAWMDQMLEDVAAFARQWQHEMNCAYVETYKIATDYYKANATEYRYADMPDRDDLAALDDAMMPGDDDVEMAQLRARIRAELVTIWRNAR